MSARPIGLSQVKAPHLVAAGGRRIVATDDPVLEAVDKLNRTAKRTAKAAGALAVVLIVGAYAVVSDVPDRRVIQPAMVTLSQDELEKRLQEARIEAAREAFAAKECRPFDEFKYPPRWRAPM